MGKRKAKAEPVEPPKRWTITIPNWCPPSLNKGRGRNFKAGHRATAQVAEFLTAYNARTACPLVTDDYRPVRRVRTVVLKEGTYPDPDNLLKYLLDGMKRARLIVDDSAKWCQWERPELGRPAGSTPGTVITIEDVEPVAVQCEPGATVGGIRFTRAVVVGRPFYWPHDKGSDSHGDFKLYADLNGVEQVFLSDVACTEHSLKRLTDWADAMGVPVEREAYTPESEAVKPDPELVW